MLAFMKPAQPTALDSMIKHDQPWKYDVQNDVKKPVLAMVKTALISRQLLTAFIDVLIRLQSDVHQ